MTSRSRDIFLGLLAGLTLLGGLGLGAWTLIGAGPTSGPIVPARAPLSQVRHQARALAQAKRFDEAQAQVSNYLKHDPSNAAARLMLAELALDRPDPQPQLALEQLREIKAHDDATLAQVRLDQGKAHYRLEHFGQAEADWKEALRLDPKIPEAGWALLNLYYVQGRVADARRLGLQLFGVEPDPHDRAQLLLELVRLDAQPPDPASIVKLLDPVVSRDAGDLRSALALGLAMVKDSQVDPGLAILRKAVEQHPDDADAREALLSGLAGANRVEELAQAVANLPKAMADSARFAKYRGQVAWDKRDWNTAAEEYRRALETDPGDHEVLYRLAKALRNAGKTGEAEPLEKRARTFETAQGEVSSLYDEANSIKTLGIGPHAELYRRLAEQRERVGRLTEARRWYALVLLEEPGDEAALEALKRLKSEPVQPGTTTTKAP